MNTEKKADHKRDNKVMDLGRLLSHRGTILGIST
jgi:hypothetical protein